MARYFEGACHEEYFADVIAREYVDRRYSEGRYRKGSIHLADSRTFLAFQCFKEWYEKEILGLDREIVLLEELVPHELLKKSWLERLLKSLQKGLEEILCNAHARYSV
jgi:hypothetical protein